MAKNYSSKLSGQIGESLVVAELGRRGIVATALAGNVPEIDVLAYKGGKSIPIQVKSLKSGSLQTQADDYLKIDFDGTRQTILGKRKDINLELIFVIIKIGQQLGNDIFYICKQRTIQDLVFKEHSDFLKKHGGIRPNKRSSFNCSVNFENLEAHQNKWKLIDDELDMVENQRGDASIQNNQVERQNMRRLFWDELLKSMSLSGSKLFENVSGSSARWIGASAGVPGIRFVFAVGKSFCRVELRIDLGKNSEMENDQIFALLSQKKQSIEDIFGGEIFWDRKETARHRRLRVDYDGNIWDSTKWENMISTMTEQMNKLEKAVRPHL